MRYISTDLKGASMNTSNFRALALTMMLGAVLACGDDGTGPGQSPAVIHAIAGDSQITGAGHALSQPITVRVEDDSGKGLEGLTVHFSVTSGGGSLTAPDPVTDASGLATLGSWTLGLEEGRNIVTATVKGESVDIVAHGVRHGLAAGFTFTCGIVANGSAFCWGDNQYGQLGNNPIVPQGTPQAVGGSQRFVALAAGVDHACGLTNEDLAYCWGHNPEGQLGNNSMIDRHLPTPVAGGLRFKALVAKGNHTCGLTRGGEAYCWGNNAVGQLGDNSQVNRMEPTPVAGGLMFASLAVGDSHTCGVTDTGDAYCWGNNLAGQLGDSTQTGRVAPVLVAGGFKYASLFAGTGHSCGIRTDDEPVCWGYNGEGQLGDNTTVSRLVPGPLAGGLLFTSLALGDSHTCGATDIQAFCWGDNSFSQLGANSSSPQVSAPLAVSGVFAATMITSGRLHSCGLTTSGNAYCWGFNDTGQLGDESFTSRGAPALVSGGLTFMGLPFLGVP
jgi:alpha-tubulin suppressor-like RCC1 family protein